MREVRERAVPRQELEALVSSRCGIAIAQCRKLEADLLDRPSVDDVKEMMKGKVDWDGLKRCVSSAIRAEIYRHVEPLVAQQIGAAVQEAKASISMEVHSRLRTLFQPPKAMDMGARAPASGLAVVGSARASHTQGGLVRSEAAGADDSAGAAGSVMVDTAARSLLAAGNAVGHPPGLGAVAGCGAGAGEALSALVRPRTWHHAPACAAFDKLCAAFDARATRRARLSRLTAG